MNTNRVLDRVRAANPAPTVAITNDQLLARIIASPGDPRLAASAVQTPPKQRRRWARFGGHPLALFAATVSLAACGAAGADKLGVLNLGLFSHASPSALFKANPAALFPGSPHQVVMLRTVRRATSVTVPGVGTYEYWIALSKKGWLCEAIRLPDGTWAGLGGSDKFDPGGAVAGCGGVPWPVDGYSYLQVQVPSPDGRWWRLEYGFVPTVGHPVKVRDAVSGATAPIADGRYFAILLPLCHGPVGEHEDKCQATPDFPLFRLETLNASGRVLSKARPDPGM